MKFLPLTVAHVYPGLFEKARDTITNMSRANYFYLIGYPDYSGYRVEHDPTFTVYLMTSAPETPPSLPNWGGIVVIGAIVAAVVISGFLVMRRRASRATQLNVSKATSQS